MFNVGVGCWTMQSPVGERRRGPALYAEAFEQIDLIDSLGFDSVWFGEHHHWYDGYLPSPLLMTGAALARTRRVSAGISVLLLPLHDPARVAASTAAAAALAPGRVRLGMGLGYRSEEFEGAGVPIATRAAMFADKLDELLELAPFVGPEPAAEVWLGGGAEATVRRAARRGLPVVLPNTLGPRKLTSFTELYHTESMNRRPKIRFSMVKDVWVAADEAEARIARQSLSASWDSYSLWWRNQAIGDRDELQTAMMRRAAIGTVDQVIADLVPLVEAGLDHLQCRIIWYPPLPSQLVTGCLHRLADEVVPALREVST